MFADWLRNALTRPGLSQRGLARHLGLEPSQVSRMVQGKRRPQLDEIEKIAAYVGEYPPQLQTRPVVPTTEIVVRGIIMEHAWHEGPAIQDLGPPTPDHIPGIPHPEYPIGVQYACEIVDPTRRSAERHYIIAVPMDHANRVPQAGDWLHVYKVRDTLRLDGVRRVVRGVRGQMDVVDDKGGSPEPLSTWMIAGYVLGRTILY
jgi:transcriptional regulator with XRE-family HTH domain